MKTFTAVQLSKEMKLPPKRIRAILRKAGKTNEGRWSFPMSMKNELKALVRDQRKRATVKKTSPAKVKRRVKDETGVAHTAH